MKKIISDIDFEEFNKSMALFGVVYIFNWFVNFEFMFSLHYFHIFPLLTQWEFYAGVIGVATFSLLIFLGGKPTEGFVPPPTPDRDKNWITKL